jgi:formylglycine-generating enzyme required for sulfatase activity
MVTFIRDAKRTPRAVMSVAVAHASQQALRYITQHDATVYLRWLSEITGKSYRLPSKAEWEKGARSTDGRICP